MGFFDLNIPYHESDRHATDKSSLKGRRLKLVLKAMELGYTGVAYNRTLKGVMSESDRCSTPLFPLSKLTPSSSAFFAAVKFHRERLNVAVSSSFRQYTRLTVVVDISSQASALNAGNPIIRSYDIVAVRPMNQSAFDQACQVSEVDMIAIDFSEKLPFRLKQPMVKAALERGVYFEITYSGLISDAQSRRQLISNCKLLVDWTRGKNLIFCSAASSATELRGPQDVANLFSLLGLPMERAKVAISKNCRSLLANALRKKQFYKEAIKVEEIPSGRHVTAQSAFDEWLKWDPISSGEGDLLLDDMEKSFAVTNTLTKTVRTVNFTSNMNGLPVHGLQIKDLISVDKAAFEPPDTDDFVPDAMEIEEAASVENPEEEGGVNPLHEEQSDLPENQGSLSTLCEEQGEILYCLKAPSSDDSAMSSLPTYKGIYANSEEPVSISSKKLNYLDNLGANHVAPAPSQIYGGNALPDGGRVHITKIETPITNDHASKELSNLLNKSRSSAFELVDSTVENQCDEDVSAQEGVVLDNISDKIDTGNKQRSFLASSDASSQDVYVEGEQYSEMTHGSVNLGDVLPIEGFLYPATDFKGPVPDDVKGKRKEIDIVTNYQGLGKPRAGRERKRQNSHHQHFLSPFKRLLNPRSFKRKSRK
ncbi:UNVERIFIED_CONTAM: protein GAMETOPHYTE defective [Sesamum calycinum]|uniref:Protein GAMETOPHYTE defective n=1 Tax=Sesamum calycinum TaxID=2727403 RepID=A0AAW2KTJ9_9LAMI